MSRETACGTTHAQILSGTCPWCGTAIGTASQAGERQWDVSRLKADLFHNDQEARVITTRTMGYHLPIVSEAVDLLRFALNNPDGRVRDAATYALGSVGGRLTANAIEDFEVAARKWRHRDDLPIRIVLLGYYDGKHLRSPRARGARQAHVLWVIEHFPRSVVAGTWLAHLSEPLDDVAYRIGRTMWVSLVKGNPEDTVILHNAAIFLIVSDKAMSEKLLKRAKSLEPDDPLWSQHLAHLYWLDMMGKDAAARRTLAAKAQAEHEWAQGLYRDERERLDQLHLLAEAAFEAGDYAKADAYASELLAKAETGHLDIFYGNQILGRLALVGGDVERATSHLLASAETAGCPLFSPFRSMVLAKELLGRGERETVRRFLERCSTSWPKSAKWLTRLAAAVERGEMPFFVTWE
jgi:hypothetical protein